MYSTAEYTKKVAPKLKDTLSKKNINAVPKITKICVNVGAGKLANKDKKVINDIVENLSAITGQKPVVRMSTKAISNFKLRENMPIGVSVTLRGQRMYDFLNRVVNTVFPRIRDFRGFSIRSFDGQGNYAVGIKEHTVFPEINPDDIVTIHGIQINIQTSADNDEEAYHLLKSYNFPFKEKEFNA